MLDLTLSKYTTRTTNAVSNRRRRKQQKITTPVKVFFPSNYNRCSNANTRAQPGAHQPSRACDYADGNKDEDTKRTKPQNRGHTGVLGAQTAAPDSHKGDGARTPATGSFPNPTQQGYQRKRQGFDRPSTPGIPRRHPGNNPT